MRRKLLLLFIMSASIGLFAQQITLKEIIRSKKYFFCKKYAPTLNEAKNASTVCLINVIKSEGKNPDEYKPHFKYLTTPLTGEYKTVAYVPKNLKEKQNDNEEIESERKQNKKEKEVSRRKKKANKNINNTEIVENTKKSQSHIEDHNKIKSGESVRNNSFPSSIKKFEKKPEKKDSIHIKYSISTHGIPGKLNKDFKNLHPIVRELINCDNYSEARKIIARYREEGKITGNFVSRYYIERHDPNEFYIIMFHKKDGKIEGIFQPNSKRNLKNGRAVSKNDIDNYVHFWFKINN